MRSVPSCSMSLLPMLLAQMFLWAPRMVEMSQGLSLSLSRRCSSAKADGLKEKGTERVSKQNQLHASETYKNDKNCLPRVLACGLVASTGRATGCVVQVLFRLQGSKNSSSMCLKLIFVRVQEAQRKFLLLKSLFLRVQEAQRRP